MGKYKDLFELLGVSPDASDNEVLAAWDRHLVEFGGPQKVPVDIRQAFERLKDAGTRETHRALVEACDNGHSFTLSSDQVATFRATCGLAKLLFFENPAVPGEYHVRRPDQPRPHFESDPRPKGSLRLTRKQWLEQAVIAVLGGVFRNKTTGQRIGLAILYIVVGLGAIVGARQLVEMVEDQLQRASDVAVVRTKSILLSKQAAVHAKFILLTQKEQQLRDRFRERIGISLEETNLSHELDACILKHNLSETWTSIHRAIPTSADLDHVRVAFGAIEARFSAERFVSEDGTRLDEVSKDLDGYLAILQVQWINIDRVREFLDIDRATKSSPITEGSGR